jgi:hypothetical protein
MERVTFGDHDTGPDPDGIAPAEEGEQIEPQVEEVDDESSSDRPEWLPDKFSNAEALAQAYSSLERRMSSQSADAKGLLSPKEFEQYEEEYRDKGELTDDSYAALVKKGLGRDLVDRYIEGQQLAATAEEGRVYEMTGGQEGYQAMGEWMADSLSSGEVDSFNEAVDIGGQLMDAAVKGMHARFVAAGGEAPSEPNLLQGSNAPNVGGYGSLYEMKQDMSNPLYKAGDTRFHAMVDKRLSLTGNIT